MRAIKIAVWCDACPSDKQQPASRAFTLGLVERENVESDGSDRPALFTLDLCAKHADALLDPLAKLLVEAVPFHPATPTRPVLSKAAPVTAAVDEECPMCHTTMRRSSLINHIWNLHRKGERRVRPTRCPDCGADYGDSAQAMGSHRRLAHDWDAVADAMAGLK